MTGRRLGVLMLTPWVTRQGGGVAESVRLLSSQLSRRSDFDIDVLSVAEKDGAPQLEGWGNARVITQPYFGPSNYRFSPGLLWWLLRSKADLVHVHGIWTFQCLAALVWSLVRRRPYVVSPHGMLEAWILKRSRALKALVSGLYQDVFLQRASALHVLTEQEGRDVARFGPPQQRQLIPNFVEIPPGAVRRPAWWRPEYAERTVYVYLGRIHVKKGWQELCAAWEAACTADSGFAASSQLVFCGWVDESPDFEPRLTELSDRFRNAVFAGAQYGGERLASLAAADAFVLPSRSEGLPMVVLEAWASRVPVLMTRECNLPIGFAAGAAIELGLSSDQVAIGLKHFHAMPDGERERMGLNGLQLVEREFSAGAAEARFVELYRSAVEARTGQPLAGGREDTT